MVALIKSKCEEQRNSGVRKKEDMDTDLQSNPGILASQCLLALVRTTFQFLYIQTAKYLLEVSLCEKQWIGFSNYC